MILGEAPGRDEDEQGTPFVGRAGQKLSQLLRRAGLDESKIFITNVCRCRPPGNRAPKPQECEACRPYLDAEISQVNPKVVVLMGNTALKVLGAGYRTVMKERGEVYDWNGRKALVTLHPAVLLRKWEDEEVILSDLRLIPKLLDGSGQQETTDYRVVRDLPALRALTETLCSVEEFAFDIETRSFDWMTEPLLCMSFSYIPYTSYVVPVLGQHLSDIWLPEELIEVENLIRKIMTSPAGKIGQNYKFDAKFIVKRFGIKPTNVTFDTSLAHHIINENLMNNLEFLSNYYLGIARHDKELRAILTNRSMTFDLVPNEVLWPYNAEDADTTLRLKHIFEPKIDKKLYTRICMPLADTLLEMEMSGVYIDQKKLEENSARYKDMIHEEEQEIYRLVGHEFKLGSTQQLGKLLFTPEGLNLPSAGLTEKGNFSTGRDELEELAGKLRSEKKVPEEKLVVLEKIVRWRNLRHWKNTFIDGNNGEAGLKRWIRPDGRIYPNYMQTGTDTGRLACREPNLQNIPRNAELRQQFAAPPGWLFWHLDYRQAEARAMAILSGCNKLIDAMRAGLDIHTTAASKLRHIPYDQVTREQRDLVKFVTHGLHYGRTIPSIAGEYGLPLEEVHTFVREYFEEYPEIARFMLEQVEKAQLGEPIINAYGRIRHLPPTISGHEKRVAINFPVSSSWADTLSLNTINVLN